MNIDMLKLYKEQGVAHKTRGKNISPGWISTRCPFCEDRSDHLGWSIREQYFHCWRCGSHKIEDVIAELLNISQHEVWIMLKRYEARPSMLSAREVERPIVRPPVVLVPGGALGIKHRKYLRKRKYDPDQLEELWGLTGTGHLGAFKFRIVYSIWHEGKIVSYQGRDITEHASLRWKSCPKEKELRDYKHCLGGIQHAKGDSCAVVEGATDGWRLGPGAVWTFGTDYLIQQVALLRRYRRRFHVLDSKKKDPNAQVQADKLANMCSAFPGEDIVVELDDGDPGDLSQADADYLMEKEWKIR